MLQDISINKGEIMNVKPDIIAEILFYPPNNGGLSNPIGGTNLNCPMKIKENFYEVRIFIDNEKYIQSGEIAKLPIKFLCFENVKNKIKLGTSFSLYSLNEFAKGTIIKINKN